MPATSSAQYYYCLIYPSLDILTLQNGEDNVYLHGCCEHKRDNIHVKMPTTLKQDRQVIMSVGKDMEKEEPS